MMSDVTLWIHDDQGAEDGVVIGVVQYDEDADCFTIQEGDQRHPLIWPPGTTVTGPSPAEAVVDVPQADPLRVGDRISLGGGYHDASRYDFEIPPACASPEGQVAVLTP